MENIKTKHRTLLHSLNDGQQVFYKYLTRCELHIIYIFIILYSFLIRIVSTYIKILGFARRAKCQGNKQFRQNV